MSNNAMLDSTGAKFSIEPNGMIGVTANGASRYFDCDPGGGFVYECMIPIPSDSTLMLPVAKDLSRDPTHSEDWLYSPDGSPIVLLDLIREAFLLGQREQPNLDASAAISKPAGDNNFYYMCGGLGMKSDGAFTGEKRHWMTFGQLDAAYMADIGIKPHGSQLLQQTGIFVGTVSGERLVPASAQDSPTAIRYSSPE